nr:cupin domain-containing protein [uncultured Rhodoferax sp.]
MDAQVFFEQQVPARLREAPQVFCLGRVIAFDISGVTGGQWTLVLHSTPSCHAGIVQPAECTFALSADDFDTVLRNPSQARSLFRQGRIHVRGAMSVAMHLPALLTLLSYVHIPSGIHILFPHLSPASFCREYWPETVAVFHGLLDRIPEISQVSGLQSTDALLSVWPGLLRLADRYGGREVDSAQARALYATGHHLAFSDAEHVFPVLKGMLERLRWDLKLPINTFGRCPVYASPDGGGEALHFDQNANFIIQIKGEKIWRVAPNRHLTRPTDRYTTAQPVPSAELQLYGPAELPTTLPLDADTVHMKPGSVLFLPRGYWHQTQAVGESLSLNFTFDQPTWADLLPAETRHRVLPQAAWRELALGAGNLDAAAAQRAVSTLQALVATLPEVFKPVDAEQAIGRMTPTEAAHVLVPRTSE